MNGGKIQLFRAGFARRAWAFRFVASNGETIAASETYSRKIDAKRAARMVADEFVGVGIEEVDR